MKKYVLAAATLCLVAAGSAFWIAHYAAQTPQSLIGRFLFASSRLTFGANPVHETPARFAGIAKQVVGARAPAVEVAGETAVAPDVEVDHDTAIAPDEEELDPKLVKVLSDALALDERLKPFSDAQASETVETTRMTEPRPIPAVESTVLPSLKRVSRVRPQEQAQTPSPLRMPDAEEISPNVVFQLMSHRQGGESVNISPDEKHQPTAWKMPNAEETERLYMPYADEQP